ncbi:hypothetical protein [Allosphingosinicella indica]|uniref:Uncharacterized protein n=1 Tax=Allosphingosinicella indica TaxID=941907 RepID=A0A1X7GI70_9SPHN|nr:hypothetical protein [Allosphingosinicella indica]SMF70161.1 hypothetical protein SAMN06295910_1817 [Allosphingosinicella indica]
MARLIAPAIGAALLLAGCERPPEDTAADPVRRAAYQVHLALARLKACDDKDELRSAETRLLELTRLAMPIGRDRAIWLGGNDWSAVMAQGRPVTCPGTPRARAAADQALDALGDVLGNVE